MFDSSSCLKHTDPIDIIAPSNDQNTCHFYHDDLAEYLRRQWPVAAPEMAAPSLPASPLLENLLSVCYQASLLREEEPRTATPALSNRKREM